LTYRSTNILFISSILLQSMNSISATGFTVTCRVIRAEFGWHKVYFCFIHSAHNYKASIGNVTSWNSTSATGEYIGDAGNYWLAGALLTLPSYEYLIWSKCQKGIRWNMYFARSKCRQIEVRTLIFITLPGTSQGSSELDLNTLRREF
jgi:hypothetical protein